ncbi:unnamed protein product [Cyberlindnera jadinii]|nr:unnamed protein product [Cyberlindnera jadinii]
MAGALEGDTFIGNSAEAHRGLLRLQYPMRHGVVTHWDDMEKIWHSVLTQELKIVTSDHPVLLTEAPLNPKSNRDRCCEIFFETFNTPALYLSIQAILALYASGRTTGVVLDSGDGVTHVVPVYDGFSLPGSIKRMDIAGRDITDQLQLLMQKNGVWLQTSAEREIVREIKEKFCYVSKDPKADENDWLMRALSKPVQTGDEEESTTMYKLPDGQVITLGAERFRSPEILFRPDIVGSECPGIHELLFESIQKVDIDLRNVLYQSVVLSGGTTMTRGFGDRLINEMKLLTTKGTKIKILAPSERKFSTWIGGSILSGLSTFKKMWVSKQEWEENPDIVHTKCL